MQFSLRPAEQTDSEALKALMRNTILAKYPAFLGQEAVAGYIASGATDQYAEECIQDAWVILVDGEVAGVCCMKARMIDLLMIDHKRHRMGLGSQLLRHCEQWLFNDYPKITLESFVTNDIANAFYRKTGWIEARRYRDESSGFEKILYIKQA